jgi:sugar-specific transcriptional regulator TrmB
MLQEEDLMGIGFTKNESRVYLTLARYDSTDAHTMIKETKFHKKTVYENLDKLITKGLVSYITEKGRKIFKIENPENLIDEIEKQEDLLQKRKLKSQDIVAEIKKLQKKTKTVSDAKIYRGLKGLKTLYAELISNGKEYLCFGAPQESIDIIGDAFWRNFNVKLRENKIKTRMIFNHSIKAYGETMQSKIIEIRYFDEDFDPLTETDIQDDKVAFVVWKEEPVAFVIQDRIIADNYREFFEQMWKNSKR